MKVVITGANRDLGIEINKKCLTRGDEVIASCRDPANVSELHSLQETNSNSLQIILLDVIYYHSIELAYKKIFSLFSSIDLLINNAGIILGYTKRYHAFGNLHTEEITRVFQVNAIVPLLVKEKLYPLVRNGNQPKIVIISSHQGSNSRKEGTSTYNYDASKAALNMFDKSLASYVKQDKAIFLKLHPGWVKTDMGTDRALINPPDSI